jgi:hypothetical protein
VLRPIVRTRSGSSGESSTQHRASTVSSLVVEQYIKQFFIQLKLSERRADTFLSEQSAYPSSVKDYFSRGSQSTIDDSHPSGSLCFLVLVVAKIELFRPRFGEVKPD